MNCQDSGFWRTFLDEDSPLSDERRLEAQEHLSDCAGCRELTTELTANRKTVDAAIAVSESGQGAARSAFSQVIGTDEKQKQSIFNWKPILGLAACLAIAATVTVPPVRSVAAEFLQLFRAEKFAAIKIDPQAALNFDPSKLGKIDFDQPQPKEVATIDEAADITGLEVIEPANLPQNLKRATTTANGAGKASLTFDLKKLNQYLSENNIEGVDLPPELDGKTIVGHIPPLVMMEYSQNGVDQNTSHHQPDLIFAQAGLPSLEGPPGIDADTIRNEVLDLPILPPQVKEQLKAMTDWKRTLPIPYPGDQAVSESVKIGNREGLFFTANDGTKALIWTDNDRAFGLVSPEAGTLSKSDLLSIADSLK